MSDILSFPNAPQDDSDIIQDPLLDAMVVSNEVRYVGVREMSFRELFGGFHTLRAITFSMEMGFLDRIVELFDYSECIIGADYMVRKNKDLHNAMFYSRMAHADLAVGEVVKYPAFIDRLRNGQVMLKVSNIILDHRKMFLLDGPAGTRVITTSANMSGRAWNGGQAEYFSHDDSKEAYDRAMDLFESAWGCCIDLPYTVAVEKGKRDTILDNPLVKNMIQAENIAVIPVPSESLEREVVEYALLADERYEAYVKHLEPELKKAKIRDRHYVISGNMFKKASESLRKVRQNVKVKHTVLDYPTMQFCYDPAYPGMTLSGQAADMKFDISAARSDGEVILKAFSHFEDGCEFIGDLDSLRDGYWRAMCYMFASPHIGHIRYWSYVYGMDPVSLPLYLVLGSKGPDTGKTFMTRLMLAAMTGKWNVRFEKGSTANRSVGFIDFMRFVQADHEGTPFVFDELVSSTVKSVKELVREVDRSSIKEGTPALVFTTNDLLNPDSLVRKRMVYIPFEASIRSTVDRNAFKSEGDQMGRGLTGAFYREFTRRYIPYVCSIVDMICGEHPSSWYPDFVDGASNVILELFRDVGLRPYDYMQPLQWNRDFSSDNKNAESVVRAIGRMWDRTPDKFRFDHGLVKIYFGMGSQNQKRAEGYANMLPAELQAQAFSSMDDGAVLSFDARQGEKIGLMFRRGFFGFMRR